MKSNERSNGTAVAILSAPEAHASAEPVVPKASAGIALPPLSQAVETGESGFFRPQGDEEEEDDDDFPPPPTWTDVLPKTNMSSVKLSPVVEEAVCPECGELPSGVMVRVDTPNQSTATTVLHESCYLRWQVAQLRLHIASVEQALSVLVAQRGGSVTYHASEISKALAMGPVSAKELPGNRVVITLGPDRFQAPTRGTDA